MVNLSDCGDGRLAAAAGHALFNGNARWNALDQIDVRFFELLDELPGIGRHAVEKTPLSLGEKDVEGEGRFSRAAQASDDDHLVARDFHADVFQVVLARAADGDRVRSAGERGRL